MALVIAILSTFVIGLPAAGAQTGHKPVVSAAVQGKATYREHCAVCHGDRGGGNGPAAKALTPRPTDLAKLAKRTGTFPGAHIRAVLKGLDPVVAHGSSTMTVWGTLFLADANGNQAAADARINDLVQFIASIQEK